MPHIRINKELKMIHTLRRKLKERIFDFMFNFLMAPAKRFPGRKLFGPEELKLLHQALISQSLFGVDGKMVGAFEKDFARAYGVPYAVASTSGTAAIHTALGAINLNPGDEVITAPITDLGTIIPILNQGGIPVFADIDENYNMDPAEVEKKITPRTKAIIVVHLFGNPCDMDAMAAVAGKHNIPLIEDCAQAHMTVYKGKYVGTIGDIGCFSFQQAKHMTTGDGGITITSNKAYYDRMKFFVDKGYARKSWGPRAYLFHAPNYRMNELTGAVGLAQLKKVKKVVDKRNELGEYCTKLLSGTPGIRTAPVTGGAGHSYWLYPLYLETVDINKFAEEMKKENQWVSAGYIVKPIYLCAESLTAKKTYGQSGCPFTCKYTDKEYEYKEGLCPRAEEALRHLICIPLNESWSKEQVERVSEAVKRSISRLGGVEAKTPIVVSSGKEPVAEHSKAGSNKKVRIGIVGCGQMGKWHLDAYKLNHLVELAAFADTNISLAQKFAAETGGKAYSSHKDMIKNEKLEGVSICTIPSSHKEIVLDLLNEGVNILCEKPQI